MPRRPPPTAPRNTAAGPYPGGGWYAMAADVCGGNLVTWAKGVLAGCQTDERFFAAAEAAPPGCHGLALEIGADGRDVAWRPMTTGHTALDFARSVVETLVGRMQELLRRLCGGTLPETCLVGGGGSHAAFWVQLLRKTLARPLTVTRADPMLGGARMALACLRQTGDPE